MIPGVTGSSQYVVPFSSVKSVTYGNTSSSTAGLPPCSDGYNYVVYDYADNDLMSATPYPTSTFFDQYTTEINQSSNVNNSFTYENGRFFLCNFGANHIYTFTTVGGTLTTVTATTPRIVRWFAPMNAWVAVGSNGVVHTSTNGTTWTSRTAIVASNFNTLATDGTTLVAAGQGGNLYSTTSTNPASITWTSRTSSFGATDIRAIDYHGGNWVAVGESGKIAYSTNGTSWTQKTTSVSVTKTVLGLTYHMGRWLVTVAGDVGSGNGELARSDTSDPSGSWTVASTSQPGGCTRIFSDGRYAFWTTTNNTLKYSR